MIRQPFFLSPPTTGAWYRIFVLFCFGQGCCKVGPRCKRPHCQQDMDYCSVFHILQSLWAHLHVVGMLRLISDINKQSLLLPFFKFCSCVYFCLYGLFNCISFRKFSLQLSVFWFCSSGLISTLLVFSTVCLFMKVSFSHDIISSGCLGSKKQLTN